MYHILVHLLKMKYKTELDTLQSRPTAVWTDPKEAPFRTGEKTTGEEAANAWSEVDVARRYAALVVWHGTARHDAARRGSWVVIQAGPCAAKSWDMKVETQTLTYSLTPRWLQNHSAQSPLTNSLPILLLALALAHPLPPRTHFPLSALFPPASGLDSFPRWAFLAGLFSCGHCAVAVLLMLCHSLWCEISWTLESWVSFILRRAETFPQWVVIWSPFGRCYSCWSVLYGLSSALTL